MFHCYLQNFLQIGGAYIFQYCIPKFQPFFQTLISITSKKQAKKPTKQQQNKTKRPRNVLVYCHLYYRKENKQDHEVFLKNSQIPTVQGRVGNLANKLWLPHPCGNQLPLQYQTKQLEEQRPNHSQEQSVLKSTLKPTTTCLGVWASTQPSRRRLNPRAGQLASVNTRIPIQSRANLNCAPNLPK